MNKVKVIMNEQHTLLPEQEELLNKKFKDNGWELYKIPAKGLNLKEMDGLVDELMNQFVIFVSPIPYVIMRLNEFIYINGTTQKRVWVFHNDNREKKELPNGKVIYTVAQTGWKIV